MSNDIKPSWVGIFIEGTPYKIGDVVLDNINQKLYISQVNNNDTDFKSKYWKKYKG